MRAAALLVPNQTKPPWMAAGGPTQTPSEFTALPIGFKND
jgi:hypothetical protein